MTLNIPELCLVALIGPSGSGKSSFARKHFLPTEVISSDFCRGLVSDDENDQSATGDAFDVLHYVASKRLARGRLAVVDATNVQPEARKSLLALAREHHVLPVAIVLNLPESVCRERNRERPDRQFGPHVLRNQTSQLRRSLRGLQREGFRYVHVLSSPEEVDAVTIERTRLWTNLRHERGPFDIIGDVHGCFEELEALLRKLGYEVEARDGGCAVQPPDGRKAVFVGDLVDRGPMVPQVLRLVMGMVAEGTALCVPGNHDVKLLKKLRGKDVRLTHGLAETLEQLEREPPELHAEVMRFIDSLVSHYVLDDGRLVVAHAGMTEELQGRASARVREFALYGETTGETDELGLPVRWNWAAEYRGSARVVYGHTPVPEADWLNRTLNIDTGCVFGGKLTALRYPELEMVSVPAARAYAESPRWAAETGAAAPELSAQQQVDDLLDLDDVRGKRIISTALRGQVTVREENATAALEVMSRFAANPRWLIYLPPTMSPSETSREPGLLEHPAEAFSYFRAHGVGKVVCQEKHMGSRAVVIVCRDAETALRRFGVREGETGAVLTRTGRRFFEDRKLEEALLALVRARVDHAGLWEELATDWLCLDCELMPWSAKAQALLTQQYAPVGSAGAAALEAATQALARARERGVDVSAVEERSGERRNMVARYRQAYRRYCWPVASVADLKLAPFHLLASEGAVHVQKDHLWHMETLARLAQGGDGLVQATSYRMVDVTDSESQAAAAHWWETLTGSGGEGMVVKPLEFVARGPKGLVQPALKCRGREYLRIIYGPEYTVPENLDRLRTRGFHTKRSLALREFALGIEALERFVRREPLRRVHECVFGVLALESEPVDPRL
ncbi:MAG: polynucleotide kinase-phosphatase [Armatimonadota bacterium]